MLDVKKQYVRALTDYVVQSGSDDSYPYTSSLKDYLQDMLPEELTALHEESMRILIANVDSTDALSYYHRSFVFLIELMDMCRKSKVSDSGNDLLNELREMLRSTQISFRNVKNKYENVLQHMDSGIALFDNEGFISFVNIKFSQMIGAPRKSLLAQDIRGLLKNRQLKPSTRRLIGRLFQEMIFYRTPFKELIDENGRHLLITVTYGDEFDGDTLISVKDVTEFRRIEQSAYYNDKLAMLGKIAAAIAHEIRNPLTSIRGFIQLLRPDLAQLGKEEYAKIILQEINRANEIINEFLNSSKPTAPVKENIQVAALVKEVSLLYESEALLNGCMIESGGINPDIFISIDVKQIKQVLLNIVKNAMEALKARGRDQQGFIRITAFLNDGKVSIMISDNGEGVEPGVLSRLFDPFFSTKEEGTGLGLSVSYRIIKNHGGTIQVESKLHEGTTFIVHLPVG